LNIPTNYGMFFSKKSALCIKLFQKIRRKQYEKN